MPRPFVIGLTGSIAMGKSETARLFAAEGVAVHDADAVIHKLYGKGGAAVARIAQLFPQAVKDGAVDRATLSALVAGDPAALAKLEALVHPLVAAERDDVSARCRGPGRAASCCWIFRFCLKPVPRRIWMRWWWPVPLPRCNAPAPWRAPA